MRFTTPQGRTFEQWKERHEKIGYEVLPPCGNVWRVRAENGAIVSMMATEPERSWLTRGKTLEEQDSHDKEMEGKI